MKQDEQKAPKEPIDVVALVLKIIAITYIATVIIAALTTAAALIMIVAKLTAASSLSWAATVIPIYILIGDFLLLLATKYVVDHAGGGA